MSNAIFEQTPQYIPISKNLVPYEFDIILNEKLYTFKINYNATGDFFTADLSLGDKKLIQGEKMLLNQILFRQIYEDNNLNLDSDFPTDIIMPQSYNEQIARMGFEELEEYCFLYIIPRNFIFKE